jgi:hypothetical protein
VSYRITYQQSHKTKMSQDAIDPLTPRLYFEHHKAARSKARADMPKVFELSIADRDCIPAEAF